MRRYLHRILAAVLVLAGPACETGDEPRVLTLTGQVQDYFTATPLPGVALTWGTSPGVTSSAGGAYQIGNLMETQILFIAGTLANYRVTRNEPVVLGTSSATADLAVVSVADANRQYTGLAVTPVAGTAVVFVNLRNAALLPHTGIPVADIVIADTLDDAVGLGPFVFGAGGDIVSPATLNVTTEFNGRSRVAFLNVPPGTYTLRVAFTDGTPQVKTAQVFAVAGGATLIRR
jgi:hypothetical protein